VEAWGALPECREAVAAFVAEVVVAFAVEAVAAAARFYPRVREQ